MKIAILEASNFITKFLTNILVDNEKKYEIDFFDESLNEIHYYSTKKVKKMHLFQAENYDVVINFAIPTNFVKFSKYYFAFDSNFEYFSSKKDVKNFNIPSSYVFNILKIVEKLKNNMEFFNLIIHKSVATNGQEAMHKFFREMKDSAIKTVVNGYYFNHPMAYNLSLHDNDYKIPNMPCACNIKLMQSAVVKVDTLIFFVKGVLTKHKFINLMDEAEISYEEENASALLVDNEAGVTAYNFAQFDGHYSFVVTYDALQNGMARYLANCLQEIEILIG